MGITRRFGSYYRAFAVEVHIGSYVFAKEFADEKTARRCFDRLIADPPGVNELRIWHKRDLIDTFRVFALTAAELAKAKLET